MLVKLPTIRDERENRGQLDLSNNARIMGYLVHLGKMSSLMNIYTCSSHQQS